MRSGFFCANLSLVEYSLGVRRKPRAAAETALKNIQGKNMELRFNSFVAKDTVALS